VHKVLKELKEHRVQPKELKDQLVHKVPKEVPELKGL
jgi:hypothetical protein